MEPSTERFNLGLWLLDRNVAEGRGERPAVRYRSRTYSYADMVELSDRCGNALLELGADIEDRILLVLPDCPEFVASWFACLKIGAVFAMANTIHPAEDYAYYLGYTKAPVAIVHEAVVERMAGVLEDAKHLKALLVVRGDDAARGSGSIRPVAPIGGGA